MKPLATLLFVFLAAFALPGAAFAKNHKDAAGDFADSKTVSDKDLSDMRGGFIDVNGMLISDFSFMESARVDGDIPVNLAVTESDLQAAFAGNNSGSLLPPLILQNINNDTIISIAQQLDVTASNVGPALANNSALNQANLLSVLH